MKQSQPVDALRRREFLWKGLNTLAGFFIGGMAWILGRKSKSEDLVWQLDPSICIQCERCAVNCVLPHSAVKCVHS